jgi:hypothetical protein
MLAQPSQVRRLQASVMHWFREFMTNKSKAFEDELARRFLLRVGATSIDSFAQQRHGSTSSDTHADDEW